MSKYTFKSFVNRWWNEFTREWRPELDLSVNRSYGTVIVQNKKNGHFGMAKCQAGDQFSARIGTAIAYARYRGAEPPKEDVKQVDSDRIPIERMEEFYKKLYDKYGEKEGDTDAES